MVERASIVDRIRELKFDKRFDRHKIELAATLNGIETSIASQFVRFEKAKADVLKEIEYSEELDDKTLPNLIKNMLDVESDLMYLQIQKELTYFSFLKKLEKEEKSGFPT